MVIVFVESLIIGRNKPESKLYFEKERVKDNKRYPAIVVKMLPSKVVENYKHILNNIKYE